MFVLEICYVNCCARGGARLADEERGAAKRRGRGLGRRNINQWRFLAEYLKVHLYILSLVRLIFLKKYHACWEGWFFTEVECYDL